MAAGPDRYAALREAELEAQKIQNSAEGQEIADEQPAQQDEPEPALVPPHRPDLIPRAPLSSNQLDYVTQAEEANARHAFNTAVNEAKFYETQEKGQDEEQSQKMDVPESPPSPPQHREVRTYDDLKDEHAEILEAAEQNNEQAQEPEKEGVDKYPRPTFNRDRDDDLEWER